MLCISFKGELTLRDVSVYSSAKGPQGLQCGEHPWAAEAKQRPLMLMLMLMLMTRRFPVLRRSIMPRHSRR